MTTENSSLIFGVRTAEAVANLEMLQRELDKTLAKFAAVQGTRGAGGFSGTTEEAAAAARTLNAELKNQGTALQRSSAQMASYSQKVGKAFVPFRAELTAANTALREHEKVVQRIAADPSTALGLAKRRSEYLRDVKETSKIWEQQAAAQLAAEQSRQAARQRQWDAADKALLASQTAAHREMLNIAQTNANLEDRQRTAAYKKREADHAAHLERQARLNDAYADRDLQGKIKTLQAIQTMQTRGRSIGWIVGRVGEEAYGDLPNIPAYRQQAEAILATNAAEANLARTRANGTSIINSNTNALGRNTALMRETHGVARGLSGSLGALWMTYGAVIPLLAGAVAGGVARQTFTTGKDIQYRLRMLEALGNEAARVDDLMGAVHGSMRTPLEAAEGLQELAQAGLNTTEAMDALAPTLQLATLGSMSVADAALTTTAALSTFRLEAVESARVGDVFAKGASISNASVENLAESMKQAGSAAATYGLNLEETVAALATLADAGIRGSAAGTAVRNMLTNLYAPTKQASEMMRLINLELYDDQGARNYIDILVDLKKATVGLSEEQRNLLLKGMFNERGRRAVQLLLQDVDGLITKNEEAANSMGFLAVANAQLLDTVEGASNRFASVLQQSYVKAFQELNPLIRQTIAQMEQFVAGDGFIKGVQALGTTFATLTSFITQHIGVITAVAATYGSLRAAQLLVVGGSAGIAAGWTALTAAFQAGAIATGNAGRALNVYKASADATTLAQGALDGAIKRTTAAAGAARIAFTALHRALGLISLAVGAVALGYSALKQGSAEAVTEADRLRQETDKVTNSIRANTEAIRQNRREHAISQGLTIESDAKAMASRRQSVYDLMGEEGRIKEEIRRLEQEAAGAPKGGALDSTRDIIQVQIMSSMRTLKEVQKKLGDESSNLARDEMDRFEGDLLQRAQRMMGPLQSITNQIASIRSDIPYQEEGHASYSLIPGLDQLNTEVNTLYQSISSGNMASQSEIDALMKRAGELSRAYSKTLTGGLGLDDDDGGSGGLRMLNESFNHRKRLLEDMRDFQLKMLEDERKVGVKTSAQAAAERLEIWNEYQDKLVVAAQEAAAQMGASGAKEHAKELGIRAIQNKVAMERERAEQELQQASIKEMWENQKQGILLAHKARVDAAAVERSITKKQEEELKALNKSYLPARVVAQMEARNAVEEEYNKLIEERKKLLDKGTDLDSDYVNTEAGQRLTEAIRELTEASNLAGDVAAQRAGQLYDQTNSATAGAIRAIQSYADEALNASSQVEQAFSRAFSTLEDIFVEFVRTGRLSFRSLVDGIRDDMARLAVRQYVTGPIAQAMGLGGGSQQGGGLNMPSFGTGGMSNMIYGAGEKMGSYALQNFAAGMSGYMPSMVSAGLGASLGTGASSMLGTSASAITNTTFSASLSGGGSASSLGAAGAAFGKALPFVGAALQFASGDKWGGGGTALGATIGSIVPGIGTALGAVVGSVAGSVLGGVFGSREPTTRRMQRVTAEYGDGDYAITSRDGRQGAGTDDAIRQLAEASVQSANALFELAGVEASISSLFAITESSYKGDRQGVASGGTLQLGDALVNFGLQDLYDRTDMTKSGFGGWSEAEMLPRLEADLQLSMLGAFQAVGDQLPNLLSRVLEGVSIRDLGAEEAQALSTAFGTLTQQINTLKLAAEALPFEQLRGITFELAANLIDYAGGYETLDAGLTAYYQNFYSQEEKMAWATEQMSKAFDSLGMTMPTLNDGVDEAIRLYRELVEAQDINTEAGQRGFAGLMNLAGGYSELAKQMDSASVAEGDRERQNLDRQIMEALGDTAGIRALELAALQEANRPLQERLWLLQDEAEVERQRYDLETQLLNLQGDTVTLRARELDALDPLNQGLQKQIWTLQDFQTALQRTSSVMSQQATLINSLHSAMGNTQAVRDTELAGMDPANREAQLALWGLQDADKAAEDAYRALAASVAAEKDRLQKEAAAMGSSISDAIDSASESVSRLNAIADQLQSTLQGMVRTGTDPERDYGWARERLSRAVSVATLTGVLPEGDDFEAALQMVAQPSESLFRSFEDYQAEFLGTAHDIEKLQRLTDKQLTTEEKALNAMERQLSASQSWHTDEMARLDAMLAAERERIDIAKGTYEAALSIPEALASIGTAIQSLADAQRGAKQAVDVAPASYFSQNPDVADAYLGGQMGDITPERAAATHYAQYGAGEGRDPVGVQLNRELAYLAANPDVASAYGAHGAGMTLEEFARLHYEQYGRYEGRSFAVGTNYVPYDMVAQIHQGERIIPAADNRELMWALQSNRSNDNELRLVQQELRETRLMLQTLLEAIGRNTNDTARTNRQMTEQPQPVHVTNVVPTIAAVPGT